MSRRVGVLVLVIVLLVGGAVAIVLTARPALSDSRDTVDARWAPLVGPLATRYDALGAVADALSAAGAGERTYTVDLAHALAEWKRLAASPNPDATAEAEVANQLEGLAARARANVALSAKFSRDPTIATAFEAFDAALVPPPAVRAYNQAVHKYESTRTDTFKRAPASLLGFDPRPVLVIGTPRSG